VVVVNDVRRVLLVWRHRLAAGGWGYEIPVGRVNAGDDAASAAAREMEEVTGWRPGPLTPLLYLRPTDGLVPSRLHVFRATKAFYAGAEANPLSGEHVEWVRMDQVRGLILRRRVVSPVTIAALLMAADSTDG
jgi:8-oxo-dGTP pyrophosphatase MutT (NUDIX family)